MLQEPATGKPQAKTERSRRSQKGMTMMKINWRTWGRAALIRAVRTFAEAALAYIGTGAVVLGDVNWLATLSAGCFGFVTAVLLALTGLPEAEEQ